MRRLFDLAGANLTDANLSGADARGANFQFATLAGANTSNLIQSNGHIAGLDLTAGASLVVRDYDGNPAATPPTGPLPIVVDQHLAMDATGTLRLVFDADPWDSTISFAPGIPVALGGTLELDLRARRRRRQPNRPHDRPVRLDRRDAHRRVHRFQPLHLEPHQSLHHRRSDAHRRAEFARRLQPRRHRRRRRLRRLAQDRRHYTQADYNTWRTNFGQRRPAAARVASRECRRPRTGNVGDADLGGGWLVSPATPGRIESPNNSSTRDTGQQTESM